MLVDWLSLTMSQTRLDRLLVILDTGSTPVTRRAAGKQLGEVQKLHPHELPNLLKRVQIHLKSKSWETRVAAAHAIQCIAANVPKWNPDGIKTKVEDEVWESKFAVFDILDVLQRGEKLLGSAGDEFEDDGAMAGLSHQEAVSRQRKVFRKEVSGGIDMGLDSMLDDEDLVSNNVDCRIQQKQFTEKPVDIVFSQLGSDANLSSRQKNREKRKRKNIAKQQSKELEKIVKSSSFDNGADTRPPPEKVQRRTNSVLSQQQSCEDEKKPLPKLQTVLVKQPSEDKLVMESITDTTLAFDELEDWPFESFCIDLCNDLFNPAWEIRHGASSALREIIKLHGDGAGKTRDTPVTKMIEVNTEWLEVTAWKLLCVFALDQFVDFVSDEVIAPVRETSAQTLGAVLHHLDKESIVRVLGVLIKLQEQDQWQVRHGGLLGLKYMLAIAVQKDMVEELLPEALPWIIKCLKDDDDDVRGLAAASLLPVSQVLGTRYQKEALTVLQYLWDILLDPDDLTASTNSVMSLLCSLVSIQSQNSESSNGNTFNEFVPRLWPFFTHNISSVRLSAMKTMKVLLQVSKDTEWSVHRLPEQMQQVFQRIMLEHVEEIRNIACEVWNLTVNLAQMPILHKTVLDYSTTWLRLLVHHPGMAIDQSLLSYDNAAMQSKHQKDGSESGGTVYYIASIDFAMDSNEKDAAVIEARLAGARSFSVLLSKMFSDPVSNKSALSCLLHLMDTLLISSSAIYRMVAAFIIQEWAKTDKELNCLNETVVNLQALLSNPIVYDEVANIHQRLQVDTQALIYCFQEHKIDVTSGMPPPPYNLDTASFIANSKFEEALSLIPPENQTSVQLKKKALLLTIYVMQKEYKKLHVRVLSSIAATLITLNKLTAKVNPIIIPIMDSVKKEEDYQMQKRTAVALAQLMMLCVNRQPNSPNNKIVKNLCTFVCNDPNQTPTVTLEENTNGTANGSTDQTNGSNDQVIKCCTKTGILTLQKKQEAVKLSQAKKKYSRSNTKEAADEDAEEATKALQIQRQGASIALSTCSSIMGEDLPNLLPALWEITFTVLKNNIKTQDDSQNNLDDQEEIKKLIMAMQVLEVTGTSLHIQLKMKLVEILPNIVEALNYPFTSVRHMASRTLGTLSKILTSETMDLVLTKVIDMVSQSDNLIGRQGAVEALVNIIDNLGMGILPYIVLLIVPILGRMSDNSQDVRMMATNCFAGLVQLMPLESGVPNPPSMSKELIEKKVGERRFLEQLLDASKLDVFNIPIPIECTLRKYQQDGVNWLAFLKKYNLHGILCDDMGLGKTLQSICIIASDHYNSLRKYKISGKAEFKPLPSLVVCPPTLTGHWYYEVQKFCKKEHLNPLHYTGSPGERQRLQNQFANHNLVLASYDIIRNDGDFFLSKHWNYCILDEGHIIKNSKTKLSKVIKQLKADHRLILSGTPIQNNVLELWSLFDFLMPGFLGSEKEFTARFGKPILQSRDAKSSSREQEAGALAMEALHKQTLPFLLRRVKEDVLQDLPPKIIQDYYCELSPLQVKLYEDFSRSQAKNLIDANLGTDLGDMNNKKQGSTHIFQALQYLRKVCNHPSLVLTSAHPEYQTVKANLQVQKSSLQDIQHSGKLIALKQLLLDCGIGIPENTNPEESLNSVVSQHRALIFCQLKSMIDIIEKDLFKIHMPSVTYSRLDGGVPAGQRQSVVQRFNNDPSIDVLLLTTHVGGLGLNLTGADTVIFVEHDWNPMKDLQAMDRAHRIGQKKVVNVYQLIARGTLEEKIMGLQKFKMNVANSVITQDNSSLHSMETSQVLDLFTVDASHDAKKSGDPNKKISMKDILEDAGELWDEGQYDNEYNLDNFMGSLSNTNSS